MDERTKRKHQFDTYMAEMTAQISFLSCPNCATPRRSISSQERNWKELRVSQFVSQPVSQLSLIPRGSLALADKRSQVGLGMGRV